MADIALSPIGFSPSEPGGDIPDIGYLLESAVAGRQRLTLADIDAVFPAQLPIGSNLVARTYAALLSDAPDTDAVEDACRRAIVASEQWLDLLTDILVNLPFVPAVTRTIVGVLADKLPDHPVARFKDEPQITILKAYDAIDDGQRIRIDLDASDKIGSARSACLMSAEDPAASFATCKISEQTAAAIWILPDRESQLFIQKRYVIPPAVLVVVEG